MSKRSGVIVCAAVGCWLVLGIGAYAQPAIPEAPIEKVFQLCPILQDTNGDKIADALCGHVVVTKSPTSVENTAAANLATRIGYGISALTLPIMPLTPPPVAHADGVKE